MVLGWFRSFDSLMGIFGCAFGVLTASIFLYKLSIVPYYYDRIVGYYMHTQLTFILLITIFYSEDQNLT